MYNIIKKYNYNSKLWSGIVEDLCKKQAEIIKLLTDAISINSKQEYKQLIVTITDKGLEETTTEN